MMTLSQTNALSPEEFVLAFGDVAEHSPWVARHASAARPFASPQAMANAFADAVRSATEESQLALLRAHPDLATRAKLTEDSSREQKGAGLDTLTADEFTRFSHLNELYKARNDFPFIFAVKGATKHQILESFAERINNPRAEEMSIALDMVCRIIGFRIADRIAP